MLTLPPEKHSGSSKFVSEEQYLPGVPKQFARPARSSRPTVVNYIAEFYSYMKAMRDAMRQAGRNHAANTRSAFRPDAGIRKTEPDPWHAAVVNVIYLVYLAYESARKAVGELIEFQPARARAIHRDSS